jgi:hypothetical protein
MKRCAFLLLLAGCVVPLASAQDREHIQLEVFADYFRLAQTDNNFGGVGALASFQAFEELKLEAQMSYDFNQTFTEGFTDTGTVTFSRTNLRILHGEFGPRMNIGHHGIQPFVTLKGGFVDFRIDGAPATLGTFFSSVNGLRARNVNGVLYPGGGLQGHLGPIGLRLDVGDEIYFNHGAHNNLRVALGPVIRF